jgi:hypothetical protein
MPAVVTHSFFADDIFQRMKTSRLKDEISVRRNLFRLGSQGPDVFFYYKAVPWIRYDGLEKLGNLAHDEKVSEFYSESFEYLNRLDRNKGFYDLGVYIAGYLCHYTLDRTAHPFIHYTSGIDAGHNRISWKYHIYHRILESTIDYFSLIKKGLEPRLYKSYEPVQVQHFRIETILEFYEHIIPLIYGYSVDRKQSEELITGIYKVQKYLFDPSGIKYYFYRFLEIMMGRTGGITSSMMPKRLDKRLDYLNLGQGTWYHPCHKDKGSKESFWDIYERSLLEAEEFMKMFSVFIDSGKIPPGLMDLIDDISYSSGVECGSPEALKYFDSIFEKDLHK